MPAWADPEARREPADSGFAFPLPRAGERPRRLERLISGSTPSRERLRAFRVLGAARLLMGSILLGWFLLAYSLDHHGRTGIALSAVYAMLVLGQWTLSMRTGTRGFAWQVLTAVLADLAGYALLQFLAGAQARELVLSYALPILAAGVYGTLRFTLATAAAVSLLLFAQAVPGIDLHAGARAAESQLLGAGFVGAAYFAMAILAWQLSQRLVRQEQRARSSEIRAERQAAINRQVLLEHPDGVLVLDAGLQVEAANPSAERMLGLQARAASFANAESPALRALSDALRHQSRAGQGGNPLDLDGADGMRLRARVHLLRRLPGGPGYVVYVQDRREIDYQIQQDKLAALGRLVAAVAHEIRNPLGAIAQANQLGADAGLSQAQRERMSALIAQNVDRLNRIVEDVLDLGRSGVRQGMDLQPMRMLGELIREFEADTPGRIELQTDDANALLYFDPQHLRRVLVNLLGNAARYASRRRGAIRIQITGHGRVRELRVSNDGPVVAESLRKQIFEPFFTTESRGTGLGLYICQELCARYATRLSYQTVAGGAHEGAFVISATGGAPHMPT